MKMRAPSSWWYLKSTAAHRAFPFSDPARGPRAPDFISLGASEALDMLLQDDQTNLSTRAVIYFVQWTGLHIGIDSIHGSQFLIFYFSNSNSHANASVGCTSWICFILKLWFKLDLAPISSVVCFLPLQIQFDSITSYSADHIVYKSYQIASGNNLPKHVASSNPTCLHSSKYGRFLSYLRVNIEEPEIWFTAPVL